MCGGPENQFSFNREASSTCELTKSNFLLSVISKWIDIPCGEEKIVQTPNNRALTNGCTSNGKSQMKTLTSVADFGGKPLGLIVSLLWLGLIADSGAATGTVVAWGDNQFGQLNMPAGLTNVVAVAAGYYHSLALKQDGTVIGWGYDAYGETDVPSGLSNVVAIAAGAFHSLALTGDGLVVGWGYNYNDIGTYYLGQATPPPGLSNVVAIAAGAWHSLALKTDGTVVGWGDNYGDAGYLGQATPPVGLSNVVAIAGGYYHSVALKKDGTAFGWGDDYWGECAGVAGLTGVVAIAAGNADTLLLKNDGTVVGCGYSDYGEATVPTGLSNVVAISAGFTHSLALLSDGTVAGWGDNGSGQTTLPMGVTNIVAISAGQRFNLGLLNDGSPALTWPPRDQTAYQGSNAMFTAGAVGSGRLSYQWRFNGTNIPGATSSLLALTNLQFTNAGGYDVVVSNGFGTAASATALLDVVDLSGVLNDSNLVWTTSGDAPWFGERGVAYDGVMAGQSGAISNNQESILQGTVTGAGTLSFWWKVSSQSNVDFLACQVGGLTQTSISGEVDWQRQTLYLGEGPQTVQWTYSKGGAGSAGQDCGWVDQVSFTPGGTPPFITTAPTNQGAPVGMSAGFSVAALGTPPLSYQWQFNGNALSGATNSSLLLDHLRMANAGIYSVVVSNDFGFVVSSNALLTVLQVVGWGNNGAGQINVPLCLTNTVAIAGGGYFSLGVNSDGTMVGWGDNRNGQASVPAGLSNVVAVAAGLYHSLALKSDGTVIAWGNRSSGQTPAPAGLSNVVAVAAGLYHSLALKSDGTVVAWGANSSGQTSVPTGLSSVVAIAAGEQHSLVLKSDGTVLAWGNNAYGQTSVPAGLSNVVAIAAGDLHSLALKTDGTVVAWGANSYGQTSVPTGLSNVIAVAGGLLHSLALKNDGTVVAWGDNDNGQTSVPAGLSNVVALAAGGFHSLALLNDGVPVFLSQPTSQTNYSGTTVTLGVHALGLLPLAYQWKFNGTNLDGATNATLLLTNVQSVNAGVYAVTVTGTAGSVTSSDAALAVVSSPPRIMTQPVNVTAVVSSEVMFAATVAGSWPLSYQWQWNGNDVPGATNSVLSLPAVQIASGGIYDVVVTNVYGTAISSNATLIVIPVVAFGYNAYGQTKVPLSLTNVLAVAGGGYHSLALKDDGTEVAWGAGTNNTGSSANYGQSLVPTAVSNAAAVAGGLYHSLALKSDGTILAWGYNNYGQTNVPAGLSNVVAIAAGGFHSLALKSDGTMVAWGNNSYGQTSVPSGLSNVVAIAAGLHHSLALKIDSTVIAWGNNGYGQTSVPAGLSNVVAIAAGGYHSLALKSDGTVVGWGSNYDINFNRVGQATPPLNLSNVVAIAAGGYHSLALKGEGTLVAWGYNAYGQTNVPTGLKNVIAIAAGFYHTLAMAGVGSPVLTWQPQSQTTCSGASVLLTVGAVGQSLDYQWQFNGKNLDGATNASLTLANVPLTSAGNYTCVVSNGFGAALSSPATLTVLRSTPWFDVTTMQLTDAGLGLRVNGLSGHGDVVLEASTNLVHWELVLTNPPAVGTLQLLDASATNLAVRFYRLEEQ